MSQILEHAIIDRIMESLVREEIVNTAYIELQFHDGTVSLQGSVFSEAESREAEWACRIDGVTAVDNRLVVYPGGQSEEV